MKKKILIMALAACGCGTYAAEPTDSVSLENVTVMFSRATLSAGSAAKAPQPTAARAKKRICFFISSNYNVFVFGCKDNKYLKKIEIISHNPHLFFHLRHKNDIKKGLAVSCKPKLLIVKLVTLFYVLILVIVVSSYQRRSVGVA